jgi:hypothetical protein
MNIMPGKPRNNRKHGRILVLGEILVVVFVVAFIDRG